MRNHSLSTAALLFAFSLSAVAQHPRDKEIHDPDTLAWWHTTEALSDDSMEGRDTGTAAYQRAADMVAARFKAAGLQPAGENGSYFQTVKMHQVDVTPAGTSFAVQGPNSGFELEFLQQITIGASAALPASFEGPMTFRGYCGKEAMADIAGKVVVCFGTQREGLPSGGERTANARAGHAVAIINVDDPYFSIEPPRWPFAYARSVTLVTGKERPAGPTLPAMRISADAFTRLLAGSKQDAAAILKTGGSKQPLPSFEIPGVFSAHIHTSQKEISSPNVLAVLPGSDPKLKDEYVVAAAHLDGYGFGTPVKGDNLYNGTLDDAAYVALLIQMADDIKAGRLPAPKRSLLLCAFTGEEKGLLGSRWFVGHPTVPLAQVAADVNLDQLRPLFPLHILTAEALTDTTLGETAKAVAAPMHIEIRPDREPERHLLFRADQVPFLEAHVPAISFIFGYDPGTDAERRYREWYEVRYHRPQDDVTQPMDFDAARTFDTFFYRLVDAIADAPVRPKILPGSQFAAK
ncbi:M28 family peptidase [Granulicella sp. 5B5]|uniref:M28 family peptidase n=1 Tax=Granulicella sp. 5B5 TaxID=1617967 RepID=UPI0015F589D5|nr:M28 family peptidase [Granulicella sp. 5B5]QMV18680.1 M28 family peptidase [Granulicella sp. 5B5]